MFMDNANWFNQLDDYSSNYNQRTEELYQIPDMEVDENGIFEAPAIVVSELLIFPKMVTPVFIAPGPNLNAIQEAQFNFSTVITLYVSNQEKNIDEIEGYLPLGT